MTPGAAESREDAATCGVVPRGYVLPYREGYLPLVRATSRAKYTTLHWPKMAEHQRPAKLATTWKPLRQYVRQRPTRTIATPREVFGVPVSLSKRRLPTLCGLPY